MGLLPRLALLPPLSKLREEPEPEPAPPQVFLFRKEIEARKEACRLYDLSKFCSHSLRELTSEQREVLYQELKKFPLPSGAAMRLSELLRDPYADPREVAALAATDPVISARLLAIINSAYFRPSGAKRISSIHQAILLLGSTRCVTSSFIPF